MLQKGHDMAAGYVPERLLDWYYDNREESSGGRGGGAASRGGGSRNSNLANAERVARSGGSSSDIRAAIYGDIPF